MAANLRRKLDNFLLGIKEVKNDTESLVKEEKTAIMHLICQKKMETGKPINLW